MGFYSRACLTTTPSIWEHPPGGMSHSWKDLWRFIPIRRAPSPGCSRRMSASTARAQGVLKAVPPAPSFARSLRPSTSSPTFCNGCGYCVVNCPFGVIDRREEDGRAWKCTLCYDRLKEDLTPACAKACPTESIQFGDLDQLREHAAKRVEKLP